MKFPLIRLPQLIPLRQTLLVADCRRARAVGGGLDSGGTGRKFSD